MRILIDIGHPGHVHLFRPLALEMINQGHEFLFTCRDKEYEIELLQSAGLRYVSFGKKYKSKAGKILGLIKFDILELIAAIKFKPDLLLSHGSPYAAHAAFLLRKPHISLEDSGNAEQVRLYLPFTQYVLTGESFHVDYGDKQIRYRGFHELAYLHPNRFKPNPQVLNKLGIEAGAPFFVLRFVSWNATHDAGQSGFNAEEKITLVNTLKKFGKVIISSEKELPEELKPYQFRLHPAQMHDLLYYATMFIGEGATMAAESAILGTPAVYINTILMGYISKLKEAELLYHPQNGQEAIKLITQLLGNADLKKDTKEKNNRFVKEHIDVTAFLIWFISNYPNSAREIKANKDIHLNYR